jgi:outer membrane protein TolC
MLAEPAVVPVPAATTPAGQPADLLRRRPDIRRAERDLAAATADVGTAIAAQFPRVSLTGVGGLDSVHPGDLLRSASHFWHLAPEVSIPLFNGGRLRSEADAARAGREVALAAYRSVVLAAFADADGALARLAGDHVNERGLSLAADGLGSAYRREQGRFRAGDISRIELLGSEQAANRAEDRRAEASGALAADYAALNKALGGGWQRAGAEP